MVELLKSKGFKLNHCDVSNENYWEYTDSNGDEQTSALARFVGVDEEQDIEYVIIQCKEDFTCCGICANDLYYGLSTEEFKDIVQRM